MNNLDRIAERAIVVWMLVFAAYIIWEVAR